MAITPRFPMRADHRVIRKVLEGTFKGQVEHKPSEYDLVSRVFCRAGGSWEALFRGSPEALRLLKKVITVAIKKKHMTKKEKWV